jgi:hypothetical protein
LFFFKKLTIYDTDIFLQISGSEPDKVGTLYGQICAGVFAGYGALENMLNIKKIKIDIESDFLMNGTVFRIKTTARIRLVNILRTIFMPVPALAKFFWKMLRDKKRQIKLAAQDEQTSDRTRQPSEIPEDSKAA